MTYIYEVVDGCEMPASVRLRDPHSGREVDVYVGDVSAYEGARFVRLDECEDLTPDKIVEDE